MTAQSSERVVYAATVANVRNGPSIGHTVVCKASKGERLPFVEKRGEWYKLSASSNVNEQWIHESVVLTEAVGSDKDSDERGNGQSISDQTDKYYDLGYRWGYQSGYIIGRDEKRDGYEHNPQAALAAVLSDKVLDYLTGQLKQDNRINETQRLDVKQGVRAGLRNGYDDGYQGKKKKTSL